MQRITAFATRLALAFALVYGSANVAGAAQQPDAWITTKVKMALLTDRGLESVRVNVDTIDGLVTLHGRVDSDAEKAKVAQVARSIDGVREVRNLLQVEAAGAMDAKRASVADDVLAKNVATALKADRALADSSIEVASAHDGTVLLGGKAATLSDHHRAIDVTARVDGVRRVASEIESPDTLADEELWHDAKPEGNAMAETQQLATDVWITSAAKMRLLASEGTTAFDINVDTSDGSVTLFGKVDSAAAKTQAEAEVRKVEGVRNVVNALEVVALENQDRVANTDAALVGVIESRLDRREALADGDVKVEVSNGVARLSGTVNSYSERITALSLARSTLGVRRVIDDLKVQSPQPAVSSR
jgi:osmotically-inducible protein OsmY